MTAPGGTPGLPVGTVLTLANLESRLQDLTSAAMKGRALDWFPSMANNTTGGDPSSTIMPFGILTDMWSRWNSVIANAHPDDVNSVEDLGPLFVEFVEGLPVIGTFVTLGEAFLGTYTGTDPTLLAVQALFGTIPKLLGGLLPAGLIPGLDASKITSGTFGAGLLQPVIDAVSQGFGGGTGLGFGGLQSFLGGLSFAGISFDDLIALIPGIGGGLTGSTGLGSILGDITGLLGAPTALGTGTPVLPAIGSIPLLGGLLSGGNILGSLIPGLDASKIVSGSFLTSLIPGLDVSKITSGIFGAGFIPGLDASKITSGTFAQSMVTGLAASLASAGGAFADAIYQAINGGSTTGVTAAQVKSSLQAIPGGNIASSILASIVPGLDASKITSGTFAQSLITGLPAALAAALTSSSPLSGANLTGSVASSLLSGVLGTGLIPGLDASKITSGTFADSILPGLGSLRDAVAQAINGGSTTGYTAAQVKTALSAIPGGNIASALLASVIPSLDASKITSGVLGAGLIPGLPASQITSGTFGTGLIPSLAASIITSGVFGAGQIPALDGSKITTGVIGGSVTVPASNLTGTITETVTGLGTLRDSLLNGLFNANTSGYTNAQAQQQAATVAQQASSAAAAAAAANATLAAQAAQSNSNNSAGGFYKNITPGGADGAALSGTDFASTGPTAGDLCIRGSNGYIGIKSSAATNTVGYYAILNYLFTTDNQSLEVALGDQGAYDVAETTLYMHCDTAHTVGAYCRIDASGIDIGSYTRSGGTYAYTPFSGGTYNGTIQSGQRAGFRNVGTSWSITVNGNAILTLTNATVTFSAARRSAAVSQDRQHSSGFFGWGASDYDSFRIASISMSDYVVPTYIGSGGRMTRTLTTQVAQTTTASSNLLPANFFGVVDKVTADITADLSTGKFTVSNAGWYRMSMRYQLSANFTTTGTAFMTQTPLLYKNGSIAEWGPPQWSRIDSTFANGSGPLSVWGSFEAYLAAGDFVQVGYNNSAALFASGGKMIGEAGGVQTYFEIALLNRSTL